MSSSRLEYWRLSGLPARQTQDEKRHDEAVADAKRAIQLAPGSADAAELASYVLAASGHPEEAAYDVSYWPISAAPTSRLRVRYWVSRWGNRPASLWIAEDFGCCASG